jgi:acyl-CoA thioester hydrolase
MPITHTRAFRVRHYECDAFGHVNNVHYLRYMQETAFDAAAAVGYGAGWYQSAGQIWLIRETHIDYLRPLRYGDTVQVKTWVEDFRRARSRRAYEMTRDPGGEVVARAATDWVYVDSASLRPASVPPEMVTAFGLSPGAPAPARTRFPAAPPPPPGVFKMRRQVQFRDLDELQHVNNAVYLDYAEDCGMQIINAYGWSLAALQAEDLGVVVKRHQIEYRQSAVMDDEVEVATWLSGVRRISATRHYTISRMKDNALLARVNSEVVWINLQTGAPVRVPAHFINAFAANMADDPSPQAG